MRLTATGFRQYREIQQSFGPMSNRFRIPKEVTNALRNVQRLSEKPLFTCCELNLIPLRINTVAFINKRCDTSTESSIFVNTLRERNLTFSF